MFERAVSSSKAAARAALLVLACALLCAGCAAGGSPPLIKTVKEIRHENGLVVGLPEGFEAKRTGEGFAVEPEASRNLQLRDPIVAYVSLVKGGAPEESSLRARSVGGKEVRYRVAKEENPGSGGDIYGLGVVERVPGGHIKYSQGKQSEDGEPDFALLWTLVGSTKYRESL